jgi:hypothetical protein
MALGYTPDWWSLLTAIEHVTRVTSTTVDAAAEALRVPFYEGKIKSRYRGQPNGRIPAEQWYGAAIWSDGFVEFSEHPHTPLLGRPHGRPRHLVEVWRADVLKVWPEPNDLPETGETWVAAAPAPQAADAPPLAAKRADKQTLESAARAYIHATYPCGIPAGKTDKMIAAEYTGNTGTQISERTVRRARTGDG